MAARYDWETIRAEYEAGATMGELSRKYGMSKSTLSVRAKKEGWTQDMIETLNRMANAKANGISNTDRPQKKAEALNAAADRKAAVITRHREEWVKHQAIIDEALNNNDFDRAKLAKITAETLKIRQEGERKAWGITDLPTENSTKAMAPTVAVSIDFSAMTTEQLNELGIAMMPKEKA